MPQEKSKSKKRTTLKPWRLRVKRRKLAKFRKRIRWTRRRWQRYHDERADKRARPKRPYLMAIRLGDLAIAHDRALRSTRMKAYHARRRAARLGEAAQ
jgi:hypothetical protein